MAFVNRLARLLELLLEVISAILVVVLTAIVLYAVVTRYTHRSPPWYDEIASIVLVWLTYYAGALAALKRGHIGFEGLVMALPTRLRMTAAVIAEVVVVAFFVLLGWTGLKVLEVLSGLSLISVRAIPVTLTQSVIPIGASLFVLAQLLSMPAHLAKIRAGISPEQEEIDHAIAEAEKEIGHDPEAVLRGEPEGRSP